MAATLSWRSNIVNRLAHARAACHVDQMSRTYVNALCAAFPGAEVSDPFGGGHDAWKVGGKIFALIGGQGLRVSLKTANVDTAAMLIEVGVGIKAPYLHRSWISLPLDGDTEELRHRLTTSYEIIRTSLTKKAQAALPPRS